MELAIGFGWVVVLALGGLGFAWTLGKLLTIASNK
jgi:hypothetical protein